MGFERNVVSARNTNIFAFIDLAGQDPRSAGCVDREICTDIGSFPDGNTFNALTLKDQPRYLSFLDDADTRGTGVFQENKVHLTAAKTDRIRAEPFTWNREGLAVSCIEDRSFDRSSIDRYFVKHAKFRKQCDTFGRNEFAAEFLAGKPFLFEKRDREAAVRKAYRRARACGAGTDDRHVVLIA
jgi:hypothetical protein